MNKNEIILFTDGEIAEDNNTQILRVDGVKQPVKFYNLDVILSVGYRVNSKRGIAFRRWANSVLKQYIIQTFIHHQLPPTLKNYVTI